MNRPINSTTRLRNLLMVLLGIGSWGGIACLASGAQDPSQFFPIGLYAVDAAPDTDDITKEFPDIAAGGFNLIQSYKFEEDIEGDNDEDNAPENEKARKFLDAAHKFGLKAFMGIPQGCILKRNLECIKQRVSALKDHRALFGWMLYDEPDTPKYDPYTKKEGPPPALPNTLRQAYKAIKQLDPAHPVSVASYQEIDERYPYLDSFDILLSDYFNIPIEPPTAGIVPYVEAAARVLKPRGKSVIATIQVYNLAKDALVTKGGDTEEGQEVLSRGRYPTREEIRFMSYYAILKGSEGVIFNCYRYDYGPGVPGDDISPKKNPSQWRAVTSVSKELKEMVPILLAPAQEAKKAGVTIKGPIEMMVKQHQGKTYLLTMNPSPEPVSLQIRLAPDRFPNPTVTLLPQRQRISLQSGSLDTQWSPYEVRIYEIARGGS
ncbi:MAG: hypothetical protein HYZ73_05085 [Elusimicrobia bacterium]|nr:hypothetical protein [Elusimicrobiota bacterium]